MITDKDIEKIADKVIDKQLGIFATKKDLQELREEVHEIRETMQALLTAVDRLVKPLEDLRVEYAAVAMNLDRHEKWIKQLAQKMGVTLEAW
jgi:hypothetical protein